jgi:hypothetical protein
MFALLWVASRGYRLAPWRSPYLRWRIETYTGISAESLVCRTFLHTVWRERRSMLQYLRWVQRSSYLLED